MHCLCTIPPTLWLLMKLGLEMPVPASIIIVLCQFGKNYDWDIFTRERLRLGWEISVRIRINMWGSGMYLHDMDLSQYILVYWGMQTSDLINLSEKSQL